MSKHETIWSRICFEDQIALSLPGMLLQDAPEWIGHKHNSDAAMLSLSGAYMALVNTDKPVALPPTLSAAQAMSKYRYLRASGMGASDIRGSRFSSTNEIIKERLLSAGHFKRKGYGTTIVADSGFLDGMLRTWTDHTTRALLQVEPGEVMNAATPRMKDLHSIYDEIKLQRQEEMSHWQGRLDATDMRKQALANERAAKRANSKSSEDELQALIELTMMEQNKEHVRVTWGRMA